MSNPVTWINKSLKTKEDLQVFILFAFIVFIIFVKCYLLATDAKVTANVNTRPGTKVAKNVDI